MISVSFIIASLLPLNLAAQNRRVVVVSPRVGAVIDSVEAANYRLFQAITSFHASSFYQASDSTLWAEVQLKSAHGILRDSTYGVSFVFLKMCAERIDHWEELIDGKYQIGTSQSHILYEDGTPLVPPTGAPQKTGSSQRNVSPDTLHLAPTFFHRHVSSDMLPLAPNRSRLERPTYATIGLGVGLGVMISDLSVLEQLKGSASNISMPVSLYLEVPLEEDPSIMFIGGWSYALGRASKESIISFSAGLICRPGTLFSLKPFVGLGAGVTSYESETNEFSINASISYPLLICGFNIAPGTLDLMVTYPLMKEINTTFESKSYSIKPAGLGFSLLLSL